MSSSDYDQFIIEKYRIAVALAVLKTKPQNIPIEDHINILKTINDQNDDDITICESDFDIDDNDSNLEHEFNENDVSNDSVTILKNFDFGNLEDVSKTNDASLINVMKELNDIDDVTNKRDINTNDSQSTYFKGSQESKTDFINHILNEIDTEIISDHFTNNIETVTDIHNSPKTIIDVNDIDSQQTEIYTLRDYTDFNTHISQSQDDFVISTNLYFNNAKSDDLRPNNNQKTENIDRNIETNVNITNQVPNVTNDINNTSLVNDTNDRKVKLNEGHNLKTKRIKIDSNTNNNLDDFSTQFSSQSTKSSEINSKHNKSIDISLNFDILNTNSTISSDSQSKHYKKNSIHETTADRNDFDNVIKNTIATNDILCNANSFSLDEIEYNTENQIFSLNNSRTNKIDKDLDYQISQNYKTISDRDDDNDNYLKDKLARSDINENLINQSIDQSNGSSFSDLTESQAEIVTFKVLEELNKVKNYLNRKLTKSDSGYRSFQPRSSGDSASQCSSSWINESAHCLMNFLTTCPLVISTSEITDEISKVLGKLIDKLHEDEIYPKFLEEILDICNDLLNTIYEGRNYGENILNKDETIQRFLFFNRSLHIIKYSIEKITNILEKTLEHLNDSFEIQHTDKSENICYIFYILEDLLKRNNRYKNLLSQNSSQASQEEKKILKKSSLTEIWRKKWNLTKIDICEGTLEKKCPLNKCSDVLNKIIVQAIEGYSLISFAALQCFNLLQN